VLLIFSKTHAKLKNNVEKGLISMNFYATNNQIGDIFTKGFQVKYLKPIGCSQSWC